MKQNIEFYPHYANADQHAKFKMLRVQFGWEGEGRFWALNNRIALSEECCLDISKKYNKAALASDLNFTIDEFDKFIIFLKDDCELIEERGNGTITTDIIQETFVKVMQERGKARERHRRTSGEKIKTSGEKTHKGKDSKGKDIKKDMSDSIEYRLANYLLNFILKRNPTHKKPNIQSWAKHIDLMLRIDKRKVDDIKAVIKWCQNDTQNKQPEGSWKGWANNILSTKALRDKFDKLYLQMSGSQPKISDPITNQPPIEDILS